MMDGSGMDGRFLSSGSFEKILDVEVGNYFQVEVNVLELKFIFVYLLR